MNDRGDTVDWFLTTQGRVARIAAGSLLIIIGLGIIGGFVGVLLLIIGAVPIASAAYGTFLLGPLFGRDIRGRRPREQPPEDADDADGPDDDEPREAAGDESRGTGRGDEPAEEPQEQLEEEASGDAGATRDEDSAEGRREGTGDREDDSGAKGDSEAERPKQGEGGSATGAPPLARAERPPGQEPRTKDVPLDDPPAGGSSS